MKRPYSANLIEIADMIVLLRRGQATGVPLVANRRYFLWPAASGSARTECSCAEKTMGKTFLCIMCALFRFYAPNFPHFSFIEKRGNLMNKFLTFFDFISLKYNLLDPTALAAGACIFKLILIYCETKIYQASLESKFNYLSCQYVFFAKNC